MQSMTKIPELMSGVVLTGHGGPEMLSWRDDLTVPELGISEVLVKVGAAAVNNTDINTRLTWYSKGDAKADDAGWSGIPIEFPRIQGADVCGEIVSVGEGVNPARIGDRVLIEPCIRETGGIDLESPWYFGSECDGGFAQFTRVADRHAYKVESDLSDVELATFPCSYSTAENMLTRAQVRAGDRVLITGASGGVGSAAVQLTRARDAEVIAITSTEKVQLLHDLGASKTLLRDDDYIEKLGVNAVDVVLDLVGGPSWFSLLEVLVPFGRYAVSGAIAGAYVELDLRTLYLKDLSLFGCTVLEPGVFANLVRLIERGKVKPLVSETFPLSNIKEAQDAFQTKNHVGKLVLSVQN